MLDLCSPRGPAPPAGNTKGPGQEQGFSHYVFETLQLSPSLVYALKPEGRQRALREATKRSQQGSVAHRQAVCDAATYKPSGPGAERKRNHYVYFTDWQRLA